ncbi:hypothetical protein [Acidianus sp. HS-5]|uniref:hypothetical protein n=1 Tax=Acidianus sp. HS-5 TaxID=2886040 RepID=UPI001F36955A|nr:hypothetical protein [Acidianus sp. HS-5]BDC18791.1 hypothetical protein HS5_16810 [Acidianus sp. HS-5]
MGLINLLIKHRYGNYGILSYVDLEFALSIGIVLSYDNFFPTTRSITNYDQRFTFNFILTLISLILVILALKNVSFGAGQDFYDGTIITFLQMKGRKMVFLSLYTVDVLIPGIIFILSSLTVFYLASFNAGLVWVLDFISIYLFLTSASYVVTILTKRPFRAFFISVGILLGFMGLKLSQIFTICVYLFFLVLGLFLLIISYYLFKGASI